MISHVPSAGEYKALITTWSYTGPGRITQTGTLLNMMQSDGDRLPKVSAHQKKPSGFSTLKCRYNS
jgi:hypothetical protein